MKRFLRATTVLLSPSRASAENRGRLNPGETLGSGQQLVSPNGKYALQMQGDGYLVLRAPGNVPIWASGSNVGNSVLVAQGDGNLVIRAPGNSAVWSTSTDDVGASTLERAKLDWL